MSWKRSLACLVLSSIFIGGCRESSDQHVTTIQLDTLLTNGKVYTMNAEAPWAEAVGIMDGKIAFVGSAREAQRLNSKAIQVIDLNDRMVMPGLFDAHVHPVLAGIERRFDCSFLPSSTPDAIIARLTECVNLLPDAEWIVGGRWDSNFFVRNNIASPRKWLDNISTKKAISLQDDTGHNRWVNSKALELAGIDSRTAIPGGEIVLDDLDGKPNGLLFESAMIPVLSIIPERTAEEYQSVANEILSDASRYGITGIKEAGDSHHGVRAYKALDDAGLLKQHMAVAISAPMMPDGVTLDFEKLETLREHNRGKYVNTDFVKIFLDGVPATPRTAAMLDDYQPDHEGSESHNGKLLIMPDVLAGLITQLDFMGLTVSVHAAGDRAVRVTLDAIENARKVNGDSGLRHEIAHAGMIDPVDIPRFAKLGAVADLSPAIWYPSPIIDSIRGAVGERGNRYFPFKDLLAAGADITVGSDLPAVLPDMNPWKGIEAMVTRKHPTGNFEGVFWQEQAITLEQALAITTLGGAKALKIDDVTGSIEEGKLADLIVLNQNIFNVEPEYISDTIVEMTMFEGEFVYTKNDKLPSK